MNLRKYPKKGKISLHSVLSSKLSQSSFSVSHTEGLQLNSIYSIHLSPTLLSLSNIESVQFKVRSHWVMATAKLFSVVSVHIGEGVSSNGIILYTYISSFYAIAVAMLSNRLPLPLPSQMGIQPIPWSCCRRHFCRCRWCPPSVNTPIGFH